MPRTAIDLPDAINYLSILDENGQVDTKLMPDLSTDQVRHFHRIMLLSRRFNERLLSLQRRAHWHFCACQGPGSGANWGSGTPPAR